MKPELITTWMIANAAGITPERLWEFSRCVDNLYEQPRQTCIKGKMRVISVPKPFFKIILRRIHKLLQSHKLNHTRAFGCVKKKSSFDSAKMHLGKPYIWSRDIKDCFPSISKRLINRKLIALGFRPDVALLLSRLGSYHDSVPQGSPLSSDILNLVLWDIDQKAASRCGYHKLSYSRFADDIVVSGYNKSSGDKEIRRIEEDLDKIDLKINHSKRRKNGLQTNRSEQFLHGIQVNSKKGTKIPKKLSRKVNHLADSFIHGCKRIQPSSIESLASKRRQLVGYLHYLNQFDIKSLKHLKTKIKQGDEIVLRCFKKNRISVHKNKWWIENPFRSEPKRLKIQWIRKLVVS